MTHDIRHGRLGMNSLQLVMGCGLDWSSMVSGCYFSWLGKAIIVIRKHSAEQTGSFLDNS